MWFDFSSAWSWVIVGVVLVALETLMPGFFLIWFGLAAIIVGAANFVIHWPWEANGILFAVLAILLALVGKRLTWRQGDDEATAMNLNQRGRALIGRTATLDQPIVAGEAANALITGVAGGGGGGGAPTVTTIDFAVVPYWLLNPDNV